MKHNYLFRATQATPEPARFKARQLQNQQKAVDVLIQKSFVPKVINIRPAQHRKRATKLPPHVKAKQVKELTRSFSLYKYVSKKQLTILLLVLMISCAYAVEASSSVERTRRQEPKRKDVDKDVIYREVCTDTSLHTYNKPNVTVAMSVRGTEVPKSCLLWNSKDSCDRDMLLWRQFTPDEVRMNNIYSNSLAKYQQWKKSFLREWELVQPTLNSDEDETTATIWKTISNMAMLYHSSNVIHEEKGGACVDHTKVALYKLIKHKLTYGLDIKIQRIQLSSDSNDDKVDHMYLLLDGDISDRQIKSNPIAVKQALSLITRGKICDTWNQGYLSDFVSDVSGYYHNRDSHHTKDWDSLSIDTFSLDFMVFQDLSKPMKQFVCEQIASLGFDLKREPTCFQFFGKQRSIQESEELDLTPPI